MEAAQTTGTARKMPHKIELTTAAVSGSAATSPWWLQKAEQTLGMITNPAWGESLGFFGVLMITVQLAFFLFEKWKKHFRSQPDPDQPPD